jgi:flagellar basal body-associated protein FliL
MVHSTFDILKQTPGPMKASTLIALMVPVVALWISAVVAFARSLEA